MLLLLCYGCCVVACAVACLVACVVDCVVVDDVVVGSQVMYLGVWIQFPIAV